ncbi:hypothetical protein Efla_000143 [Eimeria flavescens]
MYPGDSGLCAREPGSGQYGGGKPRAPCSRPLLLVIHQGARGVGDDWLAVFVGLEDNGAQAAPRAVTLHVGVARVVRVREDRLPEKPLDGLRARGHGHVHDGLDLGTAAPDAIARDDVPESTGFRLPGLAATTIGVPASSAGHRNSLSVEFCTAAPTTALIAGERWSAGAEMAGAPPVSRRARRSVVAGNGSQPSLKRSLDVSSRSRDSASRAVVSSCSARAEWGESRPAAWYKRDSGTPRNSGGLSRGRESVGGCCRGRPRIQKRRPSTPRLSQVVVGNFLAATRSECRGDPADGINDRPGVGARPAQSSRREAGWPRIGLRARRHAALESVGSGEPVVVGPGHLRCTVLVYSEGSGRAESGCELARPGAALSEKAREGRSRWCRLGVERWGWRRVHNSRGARKTGLSRVPDDTRRGRAHRRPGNSCVCCSSIQRMCGESGQRRVAVCSCQGRTSADDTPRNSGAGPGSANRPRGRPGSVGRGALRPRKRNRAPLAQAGVEEVEAQEKFGTAMAIAMAPVAGASWKEERPWARGWDYALPGEQRPPARRAACLSCRQPAIVDGRLLVVRARRDRGVRAVDRARAFAMTIARAAGRKVLMYMSLRGGQMSMGLARRKLQLRYFSKGLLDVHVRTSGDHTFREDLDSMVLRGAPTWKLGLHVTLRDSMEREAHVIQGNIRGEGAPAYPGARLLDGRQKAVQLRLVLKQLVKSGELSKDPIAGARVFAAVAWGPWGRARRRRAGARRGPSARGRALP